MPKDVFISYSSEDKIVADAICQALEQRGMSCWIAPRDISPGAVFDEAILDAIDDASVFLLILSSQANTSPFVKNEVNRAFAKGKAIFTLRIEDVMPAKSLEFYLSRHQWTDAFPPPLEDKIGRMTDAVRALVDGGAHTQLPPSEGSSAPAGTSAPPRVSARKFSPAIRYLTIALLAIIAGSGLTALFKYKSLVTSSNSNSILASVSGNTNGHAAPTRGSSLPSQDVNVNTGGADAGAVGAGVGAGVKPTPKLGLEFWQGGKANNVAQSDSRGRIRVTMSRESFEIRVPRLKDDPGVALTAWFAEDLFDLKIPLGQKLDEPNETIKDWDEFPFRFGKSVAKSPNEILLTGFEAFNYFGEDYGLTPISENQSMMNISRINDDTSHGLKDQTEDLYLIFFRDINNNNAIDGNEYELIILDF